jgi:hypothetical protein
LLRSTIGAHRASPATPAGAPAPRAAMRHPRIVRLALAASVIVTMAAAPGVGATTSAAISPTSSTTVATLTTTAIDKPWYSVETYYLRLLNCTRTGGWVLADGTCRGYGSGHYSRYVKPLTYVSGISDRDSRPYAKLLATRAICTHFADHDPGYRLRRAGYLHWTWGENIGCRDGYSTAKAAVLASHRAFQAEKSTNGGHWRNIKSTSYRWVGIGIWRYGSRTRLVVDFYG